MSAAGPLALPAFLPPGFRSVRYAAARHPGTTTAGDLSGGANCQVYAYAVLAHVGLRVPPLRSSELWADREATESAAVPGLFDLVLFDGGRKPGRDEGYGAHVGVHVGPDRVLHLCREVGAPAVWSYRDFAERPYYSRLLGIKRVRGRRPSSAAASG
ncbi:cell wall hydrolase [Yinghuangia sp. ASG 101]|uniref:cell wall hydrolase n=1 Tax=Yinghuangia sp. ASG 101 TaxID=2896848 RepID=UPI001E50B625|nr:cell wall hydrolase [Yinghuangia sp. ASG 101]UGQ12904.1 cell wall hydrolase [Yinghuangia sp. ASG 101]